MSVVSLPLVSIGLPVYNGDTSLEAALDCLLAQDYPNIEVIISDNASTDATSKICEEYSQDEPRIKYFRSEENHGAIWNFNRVFELSTGKYFMWAAHDDLREASFIGACVEKMEAQGDAVLCQTFTAMYIEDNDEILGIINLNSFDNALNLCDRYEETLKHFPATAIYGLYRSSAVRKTHIYQKSISTDLAFIQELSIYGRFIQVPKVLFRYYGRKKWNTVEQDYSFFFGKNKPWWYLPFIALFFNHCKRIAFSKISLSSKVNLWFILIKHEIGQIIFKINIKLAGLMLPEKLKERWGRAIYFRWIHNPNVDMLNAKLYMERVIKPMMRW
ncbi:MAG: glycosyltransferase family 2 protein [Proteobacteria bacterium]|nr:glycosyltransferase family 2 protein [Pseudomonadota bacterium]